MVAEFSVSPQSPEGLTGGFYPIGQGSVDVDLHRVRFQGVSGMDDHVLVTDYHGQIDLLGFGVITSHEIGGRIGGGVERFRIIVRMVVKLVFDRILFQVLGPVIEPSVDGDVREGRGDCTGKSVCL